MLRDMLQGARWGLACGAAFATWALLLFLIGGNTAFDKKDTTFGAMVAAYLMGGLAAGSVVGLFRSWRSNPMGKVLVAFLAAAPVAVAMRFAIRGFTPWEGGDTFVVISATVLWGLMGAAIFWRD